MANALKKITAEAKRIRKRHPGKSWKNAVKEAGTKYRTGKIRAKVHHKKRAPKKHRRRRVGSITPPGRIVRREDVARTRARVGSRKRKPRRRRPVSHAAPRRRRIGENSSTSALMPVLMLGGLGLLAYAVLRKSAQQPPPVTSSGAGQLLPSGNAYRDSKAQEILAWATAGGLAITAIANLIKVLNSGSDSDVNNIYDSIDSGQGIPSNYV